MMAIIDVEMAKKYTPSPADPSVRERTASVPSCTATMTTFEAAEITDSRLMLKSVVEAPIE